MKTKKLLLVCSCFLGLVVAAAQPLFDIAGAGPGHLQNTGNGRARVDGERIWVEIPKWDGKAPRWPVST